MYINAYGVRYPNPMTYMSKYSEVPIYNDNAFGYPVTTAALHTGGTNTRQAKHAGVGRGTNAHVPARNAAIGGTTVQVHDLSLVQHDKVCSYWIKGQCIFGNSCRYKHVLDHKMRKEIQSHSGTSTATIISAASSTTADATATCDSETTYFVRAKPSETAAAEVPDDPQFRNDLDNLIDLVNTAYPQWVSVRCSSCISLFIIARY